MRDNNDQQYLSNESLKSENFSSNTHNTELLAQEGAGAPGGLEYEIPHRYNMDMLVFLPVNLETSFVYWEVTPALLEQYHVGIDRLRSKVIAVEGEREAELSEFQVSTEMGKFYLHFKAPMQYVLVRMGYYDETGRFVVILTSNLFRLPNDRIEFTENEVWMSIDENTREIIRASMEKEGGGLSSRTLIEEKITELSRLRGFSSGDLPKRSE